MDRKNFIQVLDEIDFHMEGGAYRLNIGLRSGRVLAGYMIVDLRNTTLGEDATIDAIRLDRDDFPPVYIEIASIESVELASD